MKGPATMGIGDTLRMFPFIRSAMKSAFPTKASPLLLTKDACSGGPPSPHPKQA